MGRRTKSLRSPAVDNTPTDASRQFRRKTHDLAFPSYTRYTLWSYHHHVAGCVDLYLASESFQLECNQTYKKGVFYYLTQLVFDSFISDYSLFAFSAHAFVLQLSPVSFFLQISGMGKRIVAWNRYPVKNNSGDWFNCVTFVETNYMNIDLCKFESSPSYESATQTSNSLKARRKLRTFDCCSIQWSASILFILLEVLKC